MYIKWNFNNKLLIYSELHLFVFLTRDNPTKNIVFCRKIRKFALYFL